MSLKNKPLELTKVSAKSTVPVLITHEGELFEESLQIIKWSINKTTNTNKINFLDKNMTEKVKDLIQIFQKLSIIIKENH